MKTVRISGLGFLLILWLAVTAVGAAGLAINEDGRELLMKARAAFDRDIRHQPLVMDARVKRYVTAVARKLLAAGTSIPQGVSLQVSILESPKPLVYCYIDGHLVVSTGLLFNLENEAQLAGLLASQAAHLQEGYYLALYQQIKAAETRKGRMAVAGSIFGVLLDSAVDYTIQAQGIDLTESVMNGEAAYGETMKRLAAMETAQGAYYGIRDVIDNMPSKDDRGQALDPRLQFEPVADAQGMILCVQAGYDADQCARGWDLIQRIQHDFQKQERQSMGAFYEQFQAQQRLIESNLQTLQQHLGDSGLVQTPGHIQPSKAQFVAGLTGMKEVNAAKTGGPGRIGRKEYLAFVSAYMLPRARAAMEEERYEAANQDYKRLYALGIRTAAVAYGLAKSELGDFAFGASPAQLKRAEKAYREAARLDASFAEPYRGLAELYADTDDYEQAAQAWRTYLKLAPTASDRKKIERKIKLLERKAKR